jgi:hypothetical protein
MDKIGGYMLAQGDMFPVIYGGGAYLKEQYKRLSGRQLTDVDVRNAIAGRPNDHMKQALMDWFTIAEGTLQSSRTSNQARWRVANSAVRAVNTFTSAPHQFFLAREYHRKLATKRFKEGNYNEGLAHIGAYSVFGVLNPLIMGFIDNGFRIDDSKGNLPEEEIWSVSLGMLTDGIPGIHQGASLAKSFLTDKPWGDHFSPAPALMAVEGLIKSAKELSDTYTDKGSSEELKLIKATKFTTNILRLMGVNAPGVLRVVEGWDGISEKDFKLQSALGMNTDYIQGKSLLDTFKNYSDISYKGETKDEYFNRLEYINSKRGERVKIDLKDKDVRKVFDSIYKASQAESYWAVEYIKRFEGTFESKEKKQNANYNKMNALVRYADELERSPVELAIELNKYGYKISKSLFRQVAIYERFKNSETPINIDTQEKYDEFKKKYRIE